MKNDWNFFTKHFTDVKERVREVSGELVNKALSVAPKIFNQSDGFSKCTLDSEELETKTITLTLPKSVWAALDSSADAVFKVDEEFEKGLAPDLQQIRINFEKQLEVYGRKDIEVIVASLLYKEMLAATDQMIVATARNLTREAFEQDNISFIKDIQKWEYEMVGKEMSEAELELIDEVADKVLKIKSSIEDSLNNNEDDEDDQLIN